MKKHEGFIVSDNPDILIIPKELMVEGTRDEFSKILKASNNDLSINEVKFRVCKNSVDEI